MLTVYQTFEEIRFCKVMYPETEQTTNKKWTSDIKAKRLSDKIRRGVFQKKFSAHVILCVKTFEAMSDFDDDLMEDDDEYDLVNYIADNTFTFVMRAIVRSIQFNSK